ncbi:MAG: hypothetical protein L6Q98_14280 [Anaerolineae bacterium]|nr:hypothetical protein [Anaerolineae bacterium]NUQ03386.1 hypothetical protein [Anaerolineae bacterium]
MRREAEKPKKYEDLLMAALDFDDADLTANMEGDWSERQIARMRARRRLLAFGALLLLVSAPLFMFLFSAIGGSVGLVLTVLTGLILIAGLMAAVYSASQVARDLRGPVAEVEGRVALDTRAKNNKTIYYVKLGRVRFSVKKEEFLTFKNRDPYRLYYAPGQKTILSAEWLRGDAGSADERSEDWGAGSSELELAAGESADEANARLTDDGELRLRGTTAAS